MTEQLSRRGFLYKLSTSVLAAAVMPSSLFGGSKWTDDDGSPQPDAASSSSGLHKAAAVMGKESLCNGRLLLKSSIHGEAYDFQFRDTSGNYNQDVLTSLNWFLRCRDGSWLSMDVKALETLNYLSKLLGDPVIQINSGYRSPAYNARLSVSNENVARNSLHQYGRAIDFCIPGISTREVCSHALYARNVIGYGGIGYYPNSGFVHIDSGPTREWIK